MPIYEYRCKKCRSKFELLRYFSESDEDLKCPECGAVHPEKLISTTSFKKGGSCSSDGVT